MIAIDAALGRIGMTVAQAEEERRLKAARDQQRQIESETAAGEKVRTS